MNKEAVVPTKISVGKYDSHYYDIQADGEVRFGKPLPHNWENFLYGDENREVEGRSHLFSSVAKYFYVYTGESIGVAETCQVLTQIGRQIKDFHPANKLERNTFMMVSTLHDFEGSDIIEELLSGKEGDNVNIIKTLAALNQVVSMFSSRSNRPSDDQISKAIEVAGIRIAKQATRDLELVF